MVNMVKNYSKNIDRQGKKIWEFNFSKTGKKNIVKLVKK
jgi:hypothetical protein